MSLSDQTAEILKRFLSAFFARTRLLLTTALVILVAACGFTPVYGPGGSAEGLRGRVAIAEVFSITPTIGEAIAEGADQHVLERLGREDGMVTMAEEARTLVERGVTSCEEALRHVWDSGSASLKDIAASELDEAA